MEILAAQLGRKPSAVVAVARRCFCNKPQVIVNDPLPKGKDGLLTPFPTLFWLTCPYLVKSVDRLEAAGWIARLREEMLSHETSSDETVSGATSSDTTASETASSEATAFEEMDSEETSSERMTRREATTKEAAFEETTPEEMASEKTMSKETRSRHVTHMMRLAHRDHAKLRLALCDPDQLETLRQQSPGKYQVIAETGIAGMRNEDGVKCLHAHLADLLGRCNDTSRPINPIGKKVLQLLEADGVDVNGSRSCESCGPEKCV